MTLVVAMGKALCFVLITALVGKLHVVQAQTTPPDTRGPYTVNDYSDVCAKGENGSAAHGIVFCCLSETSTGIHLDAAVYFLSSSWMHIHLQRGA
jgi:hypothetical protein